MYKTLLEIQKEIEPVAKTSDNPFYKSKYFDINALLEAVKPILSKHNVVLLQPLTHIEGHTAIKTILVDTDTGDAIEETVPITENPDPQKMGSAITYFRRYALQSLLGLQAEDDDANKASGKKVENTAKVSRGTNKFKPEKTPQNARDRIKAGFDMLNYSQTKRKEMMDDFLGVEHLVDTDNLDDLNSLLKQLVTEATNISKK